MSKNNRTPRIDTAWGIYNMGRFIGVEHTRRDAVAEVERITGQPWKDCRKYMEVHKVRVMLYGAANDR